MSAIFGYSGAWDNKFTDYSITASSEDSSYPAANLTDPYYDSLGRHWRGEVQTETTHVLNFGAAKAIAGIFLDDCNFSSVVIEGHASDSWADPDFTSGTLTIGQDNRANSVEYSGTSIVLYKGRYKRYCALTAFNYQYLRIKIPTQVPKFGLAVFRMGRVIPFVDKLTLKDNYSYEVPISSARPKDYNELTSGRYETIYRGNYKVFQAEFNWNAYAHSNISDLETLDNIFESGMFVFYENDGDTAKAWLCEMVNQSGIEINRFTYWADKTNSVMIREHV